MNHLIARDYGDPCVALPLLPGERYCAPWHDSTREATLSLPSVPRLRTHLSAGVFLSRSGFTHQSVDRGYGDECQWYTRYRPRVARQFHHRHQGTQKKAPALQHVNKAVLQHLPPCLWKWRCAVQTSWRDAVG